MAAARGARGTEEERGEDTTKSKVISKMKSLAGNSEHYKRDYLMSSINSDLYKTVY